MSLEPIYHKVDKILLLLIVALFCQLNVVVTVKWFQTPNGFFGHGPPDSRNPPEVWFSEYLHGSVWIPIRAEEDFKKEKTFENDVMWKNGTDYVVLDEDANSFAFTCQAAYPIRWILPYPEQISHNPNAEVRISSFRDSLFNVKKENPESETHQVALKFTPIDRHDFASVTFQCEAISNSGENKNAGLSSNIHIFFSGGKAIERQGETIQVNISQTMQNVIIPCRPSHPNSVVTLYKGFANFTKWSPIQYPSRVIKFDPRIGFSLSREMLKKRVVGYYKCVVNETAYENDLLSFVFVNVTINPNMDSDASLNFQSRADLKGNAKIKCGHVTLATATKTSALECSYPEMKFCSGSKNRFPRIHFEVCDNPQECEIARLLYSARVKANICNEISYTESDLDKGNEESGCSKVYFYSPNSIVVCKNDDIDFVEQFLETFHFYQDPLNESFSIYPDPSFVQPIDKALPAKIREKMFMTVVGLETDSENLKNSSYIRYYDFYFNPRPDSAYPAYLYANDDDVADDGSDEALKILRLDELDHERIYEGMAIYFICLGVKYFYMSEATGWLRLNMKNGTSKLLEMELGHFKFVRLLENKEMSYVRNYASLEQKFSKPIVASTEMESVECFMPLWNSDKFDKLKLTINVRPSVAPSFKESSEETLYLRLNEKNVEAGCTALLGEPEPQITVTRDNQPLLEDLEYEKNGNGIDNGVHLTVYNESALKIIFLRVTHDTQGIYKCVAVNIKGNATRTIMVFVTDEKAHSGVILLVCLAIILVVLSGLAITIRKFYTPTYFRWLRLLRM